MAWFGLAKIALQAGGKIYANRQKTKMAMSDAQLMHAERMARGEETYQGKLLEARQNDYKDEIVLAILTLPIIVLAWSVWTEDPAAMEKIDVFFEYFSNNCRMRSALPGSMTTVALMSRCSFWTLKQAKKKRVCEQADSCRAWCFQAQVGTKISIGPPWTVLLVFMLLLLNESNFACLKPF